MTWRFFALILFIIDEYYDSGFESRSFAALARFADRFNGVKSTSSLTDNRQPTRISINSENWCMRYLGKYGASIRRIHLYCLFIIIVIISRRFNCSCPTGILCNFLLFLIRLGILLAALALVRCVESIDSPSVPSPVGKENSGERGNLPRYTL